VLAGIGDARVIGRAEAIARRFRGEESVDDPAAKMFYDFASARPINDLEALACCILGQQEGPDESEIASISVPVAIMAGDKDPVARGAPELARRIPQAVYVSIDGRNHMNAVPARQFKEAAVEFLGRSRGVSE